MKNKSLKWIIGSLLIIFIAISGFSCSLKQWKKIKVEEGNFSAMFPGEPKREVQNIPTAVGTIKGYMYTYSPEDRKISFLIMYSDFPANLISASNVNDILKATVNGQINSVGGQVVRTENMNLNDTYPGMEVEYKNTDATFITRVFLKENRLFQVLTASANISKDRNDMKKFLNSFKILD